MYSRKRFDIGWSDVVAGMVACVCSRRRRKLQHEVESWFAPAQRDGADHDAVVCLSIRSGFDLYLRVLGLPEGSEVLVSALTIPDMWRLLEHHGLVPVPVDLDPRTLAPCAGSLAQAVTERTRAVLVAHLMGIQLDLGELIAFAKGRGLLVWEDCAQAFSDRSFRGHSGADLSMFSFGPIKTASALAGAVIVMRDQVVRLHWREVHARYPVQSTGSYFLRLLKYGFLKWLTMPLPYAVFVRGCERLGVSVDGFVQGTVRGFIGGEFFQRIRHAPCSALLSVLARRLRGADGTGIHERREKAERLMDCLSGVCFVPGSEAGVHTHWIFVVESERPDALVRMLRRKGFDSTRTATMRTVPLPEGSRAALPRRAIAMLDRLVYLPVYREVPEAELARLAGVLVEFTGADGGSGSSMPSESGAGC